MDGRDAAEERLLLALRTVEGAHVSLLDVLGLSTDAAPVAPLVADGFLTLDSDRVTATPRGRPVLDGVLRALLV